MFKVGFTYKFKSVADQGDMATHDKANIAVCQAIGNEVFKIMNTDKYGNVVEFYINGTLYTAGVTPGFTSYTYLIDNEEFKYFEEVVEQAPVVEKTYTKYVVTQGTSIAYTTGDEEDANNMAKTLKLECPDLSVEVFGLLATASLDVKLA